MRADNPALIGFAEDLRQEVLLNADVEGSELLRPEAFTRRMIETLVEAGELEDALPAYHRDRGVEVAAYGVEDDDTLNLIACDYRGEVPPAAITRTDVHTAMRRLQGMWDRCREQAYHERLEESADAYDMARHIHRASRGIRRIRMILVTDGIAAIEYIEPEESDGIEIRRVVWDIGRLHRLERSGHGREPVAVDFVERFGRPVPCLAAGTPGADYSAYLAVLPGRVLADIYDEYGARLLELNVRSFLQATGKVNRGIRDSLLREPERFLAYNNGISATASEVDIVELPEGGVGLARIRDLQIVNGGQTTASIHRLRDRDLDHVRVQAKITVISPERLDEVVPLISRYANSQNKVQEADLSSNHPWHVALEGLSRSVWALATGDTMRQTRWFYERARGSYRDAETREGTPARRHAWKQSHPPRQRVTKTDIAKFENTWDQLPHEVSRGAQKNFTVFMSRMRDRGNPAPEITTFQRLIAKAILFRRAERIVSDQDFGGYRANIVAYTLAKLSHATAQRVDLDAIWEAQSLDAPVEDAIAELSRLAYDVLVDRAPSGANITEWAKRDRCWILLREAPWDVPHLLAEALVGRGRAAAGSTAPADRRDIALVESMSAVAADHWFAIANWAKETDSLTPWQRRFTYDMGLRVSRGTTLSPKQALQARKVIDTARQGGFTSLTGQRLEEVTELGETSVPHDPVPRAEITGSGETSVPHDRVPPATAAERGETTPPADESGGTTRASDEATGSGSPTTRPTEGTREERVPSDNSSAAPSNVEVTERGASDDPLDRPVERMVGRRAANCLRRAGIATLREASTYGPDQLAAIPNLGAKTLTEIQEAIDDPVAVTTQSVDIEDSSSAIAARRDHDKMVALREQGLTLREIADRFGVTAERVRQVIERDAKHLSATRVGDIRRTRRLEQALERTDEILAQYRAGSDSGEIARTLELRGEAVREVIELNATDVDQAERRGSAWVGLEPKYTDEHLVAAVRDVADHVGRTPSSGEYAERAARLGLPSLPTVSNRLGGWNAALAAAGMTPREHRRTYSRKWGEEACREALRGVLRELGHWPTTDHYEALAGSRDDLPSLPTVRNRLGRWGGIGAELTRELEVELDHAASSSPGGTPRNDTARDRIDDEVPATESTDRPAVGPPPPALPNGPQDNADAPDTQPPHPPPRWAGSRPGRQLPEEASRARDMLRRRLRDLRDR